MAVIECGNCGGKVRTPKCCGGEMNVEADKMECSACGASIGINHCCGKPMHEKK